MSSHKHRFQCIDAVMEKPSLTPRHNFASPNRSSFHSTHLDKLENHRCSLCSEPQQSKTVTSEVSGNQSTLWYQPQSPSHQYTPRRPMRPKGEPVDCNTHHHHNQRRYHTHHRRQCKRIVLIKNTNPSIQKTIMLQRKSMHSLGVFMDDVSELMQCLIRKLYTLDGHKVDSIQSLLQGPGILVCVGREPFHPHLLDSFQKNPEDKLPKLILKSQSRTCNEDQGYKKNVNFGQKSKKSVPLGPEAREKILDDGIEKRVIVNKDGSTSMEMKVRFRLLSNKTLHCCTEIKKSSCTFNVSFPGQDNVYDPQCGQDESCSEVESLFASEPDDIYVTKLYQKHLEESHCQQCCTYCQEYDIWNNQVFIKQETSGHVESTSSSTQSDKIKCKKEFVDSVHTTSCEEYSEQVVEKATCIQQSVGEGDKCDTSIQYCTISHGCSHSEVCSVSAKAKKAVYTDEMFGKNESTHGFPEEEKITVPSKNVKQDQVSVLINQISIEDERLLSVETNSSDILASLKDDEDKEETDLYSTNSRESQSNKENDEQTRNAVVSPYLFKPCKPLGSPKQSLSQRTSRMSSCCSVKSRTSRKTVGTETPENVDQDKNNTSSSIQHRHQNKESTDFAIGNGPSEETLEPINQSEDASNEKDVHDTEAETRASRSVSDLSEFCHDISDDTVENYKKGRSSATPASPNPHPDLPLTNSFVLAEQEFGNGKDLTVVYASEGTNIEMTSHLVSFDSDMSGSPIVKSKTDEPADVTHEEKVASAMSPKSNVSARSSQSRLSEVVSKERKTVKLQKRESAQSVMSVQSSASTISKRSTISDLLANGTEDYMEEVMPNELLRVSQISDLESPDLGDMEDQKEERVPSIISVKSNISEATPVKLVKLQSTESQTSALSTKTNISVQSVTSKVLEGTPIDMDKRVPSAMSNVSVRSKASNISALSPDDSNVVEEAIEDRAPSAKSNKSNTTLKSNKSNISSVALEEADVIEEKLKRPSSVLSSKSASVRSSVSKLRDKKDDSTSETTEQLQHRYITSAKSSTLNGDFEDYLAKQAPSTTPTKSNTPTTSNKSEGLETGTGEKEERPLSALSSKSIVSKKSEKCMVSEAAWECTHSDERTTSIMSNTSIKSKKSVISDVSCENEEKEKIQTVRKQQNALSVRKSKASEAPGQDTGNEDNRKTARSAMPYKSILSERSNLASDGVDNTESTKDLLKATERAYEETKDNRNASAGSSKMSSECKMDTLSNKSKGHTQKRAPIPMPIKSKKSKNPKMGQFQDEGEEKHERGFVLASPTSNISERSTKSETSEMENQSTEKTLSVRSGKSNMSKALKKSRILDCSKEPKNSNENELEERTPSAVSAKSTTSVRSKGSHTPSKRLMEILQDSKISPKSSMSAKDKKSNVSIISNNSSNVDGVPSGKTGAIKINERAPSDISAKSSASSRNSKKCRKFKLSPLANGQTDSVNLNKTSDNTLSNVNISITKSSNNANSEERASSALSKNSNTSSVQGTSEQVLTPASTSVSIGIVKEYDVDNAEKENSESFTPVNSPPQLNSKTDLCCKKLSEMIENRNLQCIQTPEDSTQSSLTTGTIVSDISKKSEWNLENSFQPITDNEVAYNKPAKKNSKKSSSRSLSSRSQTKARNSPAVTDRLKSNMSDTVLHLELKEHNNNNNNANDKWKSVGDRSTRNLSSDRSSNKDEKKLSRSHSPDLLITSFSTDNRLLKGKSKEPVFSLSVSNHGSSPSNENSNKLNTIRDFNACGRTCNGSLVTTDCRSVSHNKSGKNSSSSCRHSSSSLVQEVDNNPSELVPSILPSASPTEVVKEWLKKIPLDSALYDVGDECHQNCEEDDLLKIAGKAMDYASEEDADTAVLKTQIKQLGFDEIKNNESKIDDLRETHKDIADVPNIQPCTIPDVPSSVQLMRILLSPKLDRCNSLPEVSPVYGRKLSMSARGFLDSLVNLQLLDFDPKYVNGKAVKYNDLMNMLQSLWLCNTSDRVSISQRTESNSEHFNDEQFNAKSSSEVDINCSLQESGKSSVNESTVAQKSKANTKGEGIEILTKGQETNKTEKVIETKSDSATPDIASRVCWTPENEAEKNMQDSNILSVVSDFITKKDPTPGTREPTDTTSIINKSSGNDSNVNQILTDHEEDTSSEFSTSEQMAQIKEKVPQDLDPVWVLNLLHKIEKQFMTHYVTAMAEFKVRWNLSDSEQLDVMICELRDEVHKRIQVSINNELKKIQGHAKRPRPPTESMPRNSSILTEKRQRRLKVNLKQSPDPTPKTDGVNTAILTDFRGQQSDDEYCPYDTCMNKKTLSRPVLAMEFMNSAPMMIDFDLRKIHHLQRKSPSNTKENMEEIENEKQNIEVENQAENLFLENLKEKKQELYKSASTEQKQNESYTSNEKGFEKNYLQAVDGNKPRGAGTRSSSNSLDNSSDASEQLKVYLPVNESNNTSPAIEQEILIDDGVPLDVVPHVELRSRTESLEMAIADPTSEEEHVQSGPADMGFEVTEHEEEICTELVEDKGSVEGEIVREEFAIRTTKENMAIEAGTAIEQEVAEVAIEQEVAEVAIEQENYEVSVEQEVDEAAIGQEEDKVAVEQEVDEVSVEQEVDEAAIDQEEDKVAVEQEEDEVAIEQEVDEVAIEQEEDEEAIEQEVDEVAIEQEVDEEAIEQEEDEAAIEQEEDEVAIEQEEDEEAIEQEVDEVATEQEEDEAAIEQEEDEVAIQQEEDEEAIEQEIDEAAIEQEEDEVAIEEEEEEAAIEQEEDEVAIEQEEDEVVIEQEVDEVAIEQEEDEVAIEQEEDEDAIEQEVDEAAIEEEVDEVAIEQEEDEVAIEQEEDEVAIQQEEDEDAIEQEVDEAAIEEEVDEVAIEQEEDEVAIEQEEDEEAIEQEVDEAAIEQEEDEVAIEEEEEEAAIEQEEDEVAIEQEEDEVVIEQEVDEAAIQQEVDEVAIQQEVDEAAIQQEVDEVDIQQEVNEAAIQQEVDKVAIEQEVDEAAIEQEEDEVAIEEEEDEAAIEQEEDEVVIEQEEDESAIQQEVDEVAIQQEVDEAAIQQEVDKAAIEQEEDEVAIEEEEDEAALEQEEDEVAIEQEEDEVVIEQEVDEAAIQQEVDEVAIQQEVDEVESTDEKETEVECAREEMKIKSEIIRYGYEAEQKSDEIIDLEEAMDEEDDTAEAEESESTDNEEKDAIRSVKEDVAVKKISEEHGEDDFSDEEKISEPAEDGYKSEHESAEEVNPINNESSLEDETDDDEFDAEAETSKAETAADEEPADNEAVEYNKTFYGPSEINSSQENSLGD